MAPDVLEELKVSLPGRANEIDILYGLYGQDGELFPGAVYISGGPSSGKSSVVITVLEKLGVSLVVINLIRCYTPRILFESILMKFGEGSPKCDNMMDFVEGLRRLSGNFDKGAVLVLDKAESMRSMDSNLFPAFMRLGELCENSSVSVVFIAETTLQKCFPKFGLLEPISLHFPQYTKDELAEILCCDYRNRETLLDYGDDFYRNYVNLILSVCYRTCRDLSELRYVVRYNFAKYCRPVIDGEVRAEDSMGLWRKIAPTIKNSLNTLYLRVQDNAHDQLDDARSLELPFYAKYLLIAAYLASYNPAKYDKRLFVKMHGKKRKTLGDVKKKSKVSELLATQLGPKPFSLDRLFAIFYAILDEQIGFNNNLLVQVSSLVELQLLMCLSDNSSLDVAKYKCNVNFDFVQIVSKMVGFNVRKYLADFSHL